MTHRRERVVRGQLPSGFGVEVGPDTEGVMPPTHLWRELQKPAFWFDWAFGPSDYYGHAGFVPTLPYMVWDASIEARAEQATAREVWLHGCPDLIGQVQPHQAAHCSAAWAAYTDRHAVYGPFVPATAVGLAWLDGYLAADGVVPMGWGFTMAGPAAAIEEGIRRVLAWMRGHRLARPFVLTGVNAGEQATYREQTALMTYLRQRALLRYPLLHAVAWNRGYTVEETTYRLIGSTGRRSWTGVRWCHHQKELRRVSQGGFAAVTPYHAGG